MQDFPAVTDHTATVEPVPRRLRGYLGGRCVLDTVAAVYVWDSPKYPAYHVPLAALDPALLTDEGHPRRLLRGLTRTFSIGWGETLRRGAVRAYTEDADPEVAGSRLTRARMRGAIKIAADFALLAAAVNLARLGGLAAVQPAATAAS